ncbi:MAG: hypothetical protein HGA44_17780 [Cellulomonadaceae bacterium]|nr:hypothetical protein [Cellulomonadaceae bacterium]
MSVRQILVVPTLIRMVATDLGWTESAGVYERTGIVAALVGAALLLAVGWALLCGGTLERVASAAWVGREGRWSPVRK